MSQLFGGLLTQTRRPGDRRLTDMEVRRALEWAVRMSARGDAGGFAGDDAAGTALVRPPAPFLARIIGASEPGSGSGSGSGAETWGKTPYSWVAQYELPDGTLIDDPADPPFTGDADYLPLFELNDSPDVPTDGTLIAHAWWGEGGDYLWFDLSAGGEPPVPAHVVITDDVKIGVPTPYLYACQRTTYKGAGDQVAYHDVGWARSPNMERLVECREYYTLRCDRVGDAVGFVLDGMGDGECEGADALNRTWVLDKIQEVGQSVYWMFDVAEFCGGFLSAFVTYDADSSQWLLGFVVYAGPGATGDPVVAGQSYVNAAEPLSWETGTDEMEMTLDGPGEAWAVGWPDTITVRRAVSATSQLNRKWVYRTQETSDTGSGVGDDGSGAPLVGADCPPALCNGNEIPSTLYLTFTPLSYCENVGSTYTAVLRYTGIGWQGHALNPANPTPDDALTYLVDMFCAGDVITITMSSFTCQFGTNFVPDSYDPFYANFEADGGGCCNTPGTMIGVTLTETPP